MTDHERQRYNAALTEAEAATDRLRAAAPLIAEAMRGWAEVVLALAGHDLNGMRTVVEGEQLLAHERETRQEAILLELRRIREHLDTLDDLAARVAALEARPACALMAS